MFETFDIKRSPSVKVCPYDNADDWNEYDRDLYFELLRKSTQEITVCKRLKSGCYHVPNQYMVDNSSRLICYCAYNKSGTKYTLNYAENNGVKIPNLYHKMDH